MRCSSDSPVSLESLRRGALAIALAVLLAMPGAVQAQSALQSDEGDARPTLRETDYGQWERLGGPVLSPEGTWMATPIRRVNGNHELRIHHTRRDTSITVDFGQRPAFSADGRWLAYGIGMSEDRREKLRKAKKPVRRKLGLLNLQTGDTTVVGAVSGFQFSDDGRYLAMRRYPPKGAPEEARGADLLLRDLREGTYNSFGNVASFAWQDDGPLLAMTIDGASKTGNGVRLYDASNGRLQVLASTPADYTGLTWRPAEDDLAALRVHDPEGEKEKTHTLLAWRGLRSRVPPTRRFDPAEAVSFPDSLRIVDYRDPQWAADGDRVLFGVQKRDAAQETSEAVGSDSTATDSTAADSTLENYEPADVQVWHADDVEIIPRQEVQAEQDRRDNYLAAWHLGENASDRWTRLGTEKTEDVQVLEGGARAVGLDQTPYQEERMFGPVYHDLYVIDVATGERERVAQKVQFWQGPSPGGRYLLWLKDDQYHAYDTQQETTATLTGDLPVPVVDRDDDRTIEQKPPFGVAGWTAGDQSVLVYSEYDVWRVSPDGADMERLTQGRPDSVQHRYTDLTDEAPGEPDFIPRDGSVYWKTYDEWSEKHGYARSERLSVSPERLLWKSKQVAGLMRADSADVYAYRIADFEDSPDYFRAGPALAEAQSVTRTNPFQDNYAWGRSTLVSYRNADGERLQGALFYPADYDPSKSYPMLTYIYETRSPQVRSYTAPTRQHPYNTTVFTQEGYFVFQPDITYRPRDPGRSAVDAIVPAVEKVMEEVPVDPERVGLVGHSWGGYQTAFTVTQTDLFNAAVAGAPLTNMVSMYNSIYWRTGGTDARIFEISQGRMEVPPWKDMEAYVTNSPLHQIESLNTPLLVAQGTDDGAVEFNQGVEFYNAARRAGKQVAFLAYAGENHGISKEDKNAVDYRNRVLEWFGHYLKGDSGPAWIEEGVPYLQQVEEEETASASAPSR